MIHTRLHAGHRPQAVRSGLSVALVHMQEETDRVAAMSLEERRKHKQQQRKEAARAKKREEEAAEKESAAAADSAAAKDKAGKKPAASKRSARIWVLCNWNYFSITCRMPCTLPSGHQLPCHWTADGLLL